MFQNTLIEKIVEFLTSIGIEVVPARLEGACFLPGIQVESGRLLVDESKLEYPGDILHEAGHLAVAPSAVRPSLSGEVIIPGEEMDVVEVEVSAWAYAAIVHLGLDPTILFHSGGYRGQSKDLLFTYCSGVHLGTPGLEAAGMTATGNVASDLGVAPYPHMLKWLRD